MYEEKPFLYTLKFFLIALITGVIILCVGFAFVKIVDKSSSAPPLPTSTENDKTKIVIDPGHGGEDPGAVGADGTLEKDLNLEIANLLYALCVLNGYEAIMTRDKDTLLYDYYDDLEDYTGQKKVYDLKNRLKIAEEYENAIYLGIHMNKFSQEKYSGTQIYYSKNNDLSGDIAKTLKDDIKANLQPNNTREIKGANSSIYILNNIENPAVLIECGFLSNQDELENLKNEQYRAKLALVIFSAICKY